MIVNEFVDVYFILNMINSAHRNSLIIALLIFKEG